MALSIVLLLGWGGAAAAQSSLYNFTFSANGGTYSGSGTITIVDATRAVTDAALTINGVSTTLNTTTGFNQTRSTGSTPLLTNVAASPFFSAGPAAERVVVAAPGASLGQSFEFFQSGGVDRFAASDGNGIQFNQQLDSESLTFVSLVSTPAPVPAGGALSWLFAAAAFVCWRVRKGVSAKSTEAAT